MPRCVGDCFGREWWARAHDAHVALQNVDELREFVEAELAQHAAQRIDARVVLHLEGRAGSFVELHQFLLAFFGIYVHAAEFVHGEQLAVLADAGLLEDDRALRVAELDRECAEQEHWRQADERKGYAGNIDETLHESAVGTAGGLWENVVGIVQAGELEEGECVLVELLDVLVFVCSFCFWRAGVYESFENRALRVEAEHVHELSLVQSAQNFFLDFCEVFDACVQQDQAEAAVRKEPENIDELEFCEQGKYAELPGADRHVVLFPVAENFKLVDVDFNQGKGAAIAVCAQELLFQAMLKKVYRINEMLEIRRSKNFFQITLW